MRTRRRNATIVGGILLAVVALGTIRSPSRIENAIAPPESFTSGEAASPTDPDSQVFVQLISGSLETLIGEGRELAELGKSRSRNILQLSIRMDRFKSASRQLEAVIEANVVPSALNVDIESLKLELVRADLAIEGSVGAVRSFDWDALASYVSEFDNAIQSCAVIAERLYS